MHVCFCCITMLQYLSKQNRLLRQAAESRLRLCEQLEASAAEADRVRADLHHQIDSQRHRHTTYVVYSNHNFIIIIITIKKRSH